MKRRYGYPAMRFLITMFAVLAFLSIVPAEAAPDVCVTHEADATLVRAEVTVGGLGCIDATVERCTLEHDPEYPGHPTWQCRPVV